MYKLPRQIISPEIAEIVTREIRKQKIEVIKASKKNLKELFEICKAVVETGLPEYLVCKNLPKKLGKGLFLHPEAEPILKGQLIGTYSGVVSIVGQNMPGDSSYAFAPIVDILLSKEEQARFDPKKKFHPRRLYALDVDAEHDGNFIRLINHSDKPNVEAQLFKIPKNDFSLPPSPIEVIYVAKKTIRPGEQLLVCYDGDDNSYWDNLNITPLPITPQTFRLSPKLEIVKTPL